MLLSSVEAWLTKAFKLVESNGCRIINFQLRNKFWSNNQFEASFKTLVFNLLWNRKTIQHTGGGGAKMLLPQNHSCANFVEGFFTSPSQNKNGLHNSLG